jgi:polysaccharide deacetylase family protein (PEP-CTERM system associated)
MNSSNPSILLTIDVEDWFQVENFKKHIPFSSWPNCELRVEKNTHHILNLLDSHSAQGIRHRAERVKDPPASQARALRAGNGPRTRPPRLSPPVTARHERAGESDGGQATDNRPENNTSLRQRRIASSQFQEETEKTRKSSESRKSCLTMPKATFFILGWIAERLPHLVKEIHSRGHEVASHGYRHNLCTDCSSEDLKTDLIESKKRLEDTIGAQVFGYRAPSFSINDDILKIIEQCGYLYDSSFNSFGMHRRYGHLDLSRNRARGIAVPVNQKSSIENRQFFELPISNINLLKSVLPWGGGGYFRLIPFPLFKIGIKFFLGQQNAYLFYLHPWEIDPEQPRVNQASAFSKFRHYNNLGKTASKLSSFIEAFKDCNFTTCHQYLELKTQ